MVSFPVTSAIMLASLQERNMELLQDRLDVKNKTRANLFNWRGQFTPQFVDYILETFASSDDVIVDPFSGSGTVLLESARKQLPCYGFEINPAAYAMSKFFSLCNLSHNDRIELSFSYKNKINKLVNSYDGLPIFTPQDSFRDSYRNLLQFSRDLFSQTLTQREKLLAVNTLFAAEDYRNGDVVTTITKAVRYITDCLSHLPYTVKPIGAYLRDARLLNEYCPTPVDLIVTSPPYINVFNYHQNHRAIIESLGWDILNIAHSEIGSNRKNRGNRFKTVVQYCLDMELTLKAFWHSLRTYGTAIMVIGRESNVRKTPFYNGKMVGDIAQGLEAFSDVQNYTRTFSNKFGMDIKEDIIILKKTDTYPKDSIARDVSARHLEASLDTATEEAKRDIIDVLVCIDRIHPSPYLSSERDWLDDKDAS